MDEKIVIKQRGEKYHSQLRKYILLWIVCGIVFGFFCIFIWPNMVPLALPEGLIYIPLGIFTGISAVGIWVFPLLILFYLVLTMKKEPILRIDVKGVYPRRGMMNVEFVLWEDIERIYLNTIEAKTCIAFILKDEKTYLDKCSKRRKRELKMRKGMGHELIVLSLEKIEIPAEELFDKIQVIFDKSKMQTK